MLIIIFSSKCTEGYEYDRVREQCRGEKFKIALHVKHCLFLIFAELTLNEFDSVFNHNMLHRICLIN